MEFWEFLIQQEGDRSWLPLESPSVEILEGRYRVVARSSRTNTVTEIRVTHYATDETPPVRRVRKRSSQTNPDGLVVILPFTRMQPGLWELRCTGDVMAEMMGDNWQHVVQIDVLPQSLMPEELDEPDPNWQITAAEGSPELASELMSASGTNVTAADAESDLAVTDDSPVTNNSPVTDDSPIREVDESDAVPIAAARDGDIVDVVNDAAEAAPKLADRSVDYSSDEPANDWSANDLDDDSLSEADSSAVQTDTESTNDSPITVPIAEQFAEQSPAEQFPTEPSPAEQSPIYGDLTQTLQQVEQASEQIVDSLFRNLGELSDAAAPAQLQVQLERETFVIQRGETLTLTGRLEFPPEQTWQVAISELRVRLYDPQTSQILMDEVHPIDQRMPPFPFSGTISLPEHYQTYLVLGELIFEGTLPNAAPQTLAIRSFYVTTDLHELIESLANNFPDSETLPSDLLTPEPLPAAELNRLSRHASHHAKHRPATVPPQRAANRPRPSLQLPTFGSTGSTTAATRVDNHSAQTEPAAIHALNQTPTAQPSTQPSTQPDQSSDEANLVSTSAADLLLSQAEADQLEASATLGKSSDADPTSTAPTSPSVLQSHQSHLIELARSAQLGLAQAHQTESDSASASNQTSDQSSSQSTGESDDLFFDWNELEQPVSLWRRQRRTDLPSKPEDVSFRALNLENRFLQRLQALATNPEASATLGLIEASENMINAAATGQRAGAMPRSTAYEADLTAHEIVVDDELPIEDAPPATAFHETSPSLTELPTGTVLPADEPIPTPRLQLPNGDMVAGQPIAITIKLPHLLARVYVKLWLRDRQTRELLSTPRWIVDFTPDGFGNQMSRTEVIVPPGYLKVQFEAIAVEIATQRESDKVTMTRPIVPPDLSPLSLDGLEL